MPNCEHCGSHCFYSVNAYDCTVPCFSLPSSSAGAVLLCISLWLALTSLGRASRGRWIGTSQRTLSIRFSELCFTVQIMLRYGGIMRAIVMVWVLACLFVAALPLMTAANTYRLWTHTAHRSSEPTLTDVFEQQSRGAFPSCSGRLVRRRSRHAVGIWKKQRFASHDATVQTLSGY